MWWRRCAFLLLLGSCSGEDKRPGSEDLSAAPPMPEIVVEAGDDVVAMEAVTAIEEDTVEFEETVGRALEAAREADGAASVCDSAFQSVEAMVREVAAQYPDRVHSMPPRRAFMRICQSLPPDAQQCLVASYAVEHLQECTEVQGSLPDEQRVRLEAVLAGG